MDDVLKRIMPQNVTSLEKAFGLQPNTKNENPVTTLRNWITFNIRNQLMKEERRAYYHSSYSNRSISSFLKTFKSVLQQELQNKYLLYKYRGLADKFEKTMLVGNILGEIRMIKLFGLIL